MVCDDVRRIMPAALELAQRAPRRRRRPACIDASAPDQNGSPTTAASCRSERWADVSASSRAAIKAVDRLRQRDRARRRRRPPVAEHPDELERVQRIASGARDERCLRLGGQDRSARAARRAAAASSSSGERRERDGRRVRLAAAPVAADVEELRARRPHEQERRVLGAGRPADPGSRAWTGPPSGDPRSRARVGACAASATRNRVHAANDSSRLAAAELRLDQPEQRREPRAQATRLPRCGAPSERRCVSSLPAASSRSSERITPVASRTTSSSGANVTDSP